MGQTIKLNQKANVKQKTDADVLPSNGLPVIAEYTADSVIGQQLIPASGSLPFSIDTTKPQNVWVFVNGQRLLPTKDFTFLNVDGSGLSSQIQLNSALGDVLPICISKLGIKPEAELGVDTRFQELYDVGASETQGYVDESAQLTAVNGVPSTGQFRTFGITGRASIPDLGNNLRVRGPVDRVPSQFISRLATEVGANGENVWSSANDDSNLIRYVGFGWTSVPDVLGPRVYTGTQNDYLEIIFYGTGLNLLYANAHTASEDIRATVDNGAEGGNLLLSNNATLISQRSYAANQVIQVVNNLTLGLHSVKIRVNGSSGTNHSFFGYETLNESNNINVRPGTIYVGNRKRIYSAASSFAYNTSFDSITQGGSSTGSIGTRGARVLVYAKSDLTIGKAAYLVNGASALGSSADHTYEEVVRVHRWREFGAASSNNDGFAFQGSSNTNLAFTLDDGESSLYGANLDVGSGLSYDGMLLTSNGAFVTLTFVGTGVDFIRRDAANGGSDTYNFQIDGGATQSLTAVGNTNEVQVKLASGLPYGTHTLKINRVSAATFAIGIKAFVVYQPKKPSLPVGAVELGEYNIVANFSSTPRAGSNGDEVCQGVIRKCASREFQYGGGWSNSGIATTVGEIGQAAHTGFDVFSGGGSGRFFQYSFWGTGFDMRGFRNSDRTTTATVTIDGVTLTAANFPSAVISTVGWTFNTSTGILNQNAVSASDNASLTVSGLSTGYHVLKVTNNDGTNQLCVSSLDIIMPIHVRKAPMAYVIQNASTIGNASINDLRQNSPSPLSAKKNSFQAIGTLSDPTNGNTTFVPIADMAGVLKCSGKRVNIFFSGTFNCSSTVIPHIAIFVDGVQVSPEARIQFSSTNFPQAMSMQWSGILSPGFHNIEARWKTNGSTITAEGVRRSLFAEEAA